MDPALVYDAGRFVSDNYAYLSPAFSDTLPMALPAPGLGVLAVVYPHGEWYVMAGLHDANGSRTSGDPSGFFREREYFTALEVGFDPNHGRDRAGHYHLTFWHVDEREDAAVESGHGVAVTLEQEFGRKPAIVPFLRYAWADGGGRAVRQNLSVGVGFEAPFGQNDDLLAVGGSWGQPVDRRLRDQYVLETFYRVHLTPHLHLSPDLQVIFRPSKAPREDIIAVLGLRLRLLF